MLQKMEKKFLCFCGGLNPLVPGDATEKAHCFLRIRIHILTECTYVYGDLRQQERSAAPVVVERFFFSERNRSILSASLSPRPILYGRIRPAVGVCFICNHLHIAPSANLRQHAGSQTGDIVHLHNISYVSSTYSNIPALGTVFKNA